MNIIDQSVEVLYPRTLEDGISELKAVESAGRNCWRSEGRMTDDSYKTFVPNLMKRGHGSPLEFGHVRVRIVTGRDVLAEITRHRIGVAFAVESQRYVNEAKDDGGIKFIRPLFYVPFDPYYNYSLHRDGERDQNYEASRLWDDAMELAEDEYNRLIALGMMNQDARKVLPNSCATTIVMDMNLRALLHIYELRSAKFAYPEMRECMRLLKQEVDKVLPGFLPEEEGKE